MTGGSSGSSVLGYDSFLLQASNFPPQLTPFYYDAIQPIRETPPVLSPEYETDLEKSSPSYWEKNPLTIDYFNIGKTIEVVVDYFYTDG